MFGYRGQWRLDIERHRGEHAEHDAVYTSVTPEDFAKVAAREGWEATVTNNDDAALVALTRDRRACAAFMDWRVPGQNLYSQVTFQAELRLKRPLADDAIARVNSMMRFVKVWRTDGRTVRMHMPVALNGGVTATWLAHSLQQWIGSWCECERQLRRAVMPARRHKKVQRTELVH